MKEDRFDHYHIHFHGSKFDGMITGEEAAKDIEKYEKNIYAITDHGTLNSVLELHGICKKKKIKFAPGSEMYVVENKEEKNDGPRKRKFDKKRHVVLISQNQKGFDNLIYLGSLASMYFFGKPRIDHNDIFEKNEGLICTTACMGGIVAAPYLWDEDSTELEREKNAEEIALRYKEAFGDRFFLEIQPVDKPEQLKLNRFLMRIGKKNKINIIATNDCHYAEPDHYKYHARLISLQNAGRKSESESELFYKQGHHLRSYSEMFDAFVKNGTTSDDCQNEVIDALETANNLHERIEGVKIERTLKIPKYRENEDG